MSRIVPHGKDTEPVENMTSHREDAGRNGREGLGQLLRSRSVQVLLASVALAQGTLAAERSESEGMKTGKKLQAWAEQRRAEALPPVVVTGIALSDEVVEPKVAAAPRDGDDEARALAEKYSRKGYKVSPSLARIILEAAEENDISTETAFGLIRAESGFRTTVTSPVGAVGLTQLMPKTASWLQPGVKRSDLRDPKTNVRIGFKYLRSLIKKYDGNERLALLAYNRGPGTVDKALRRGVNPDNGYADFVHGKADHGHTLYTSDAPKTKAKAKKSAKKRTSKPAARKAKAAKKPTARKAKTSGKKATAKRSKTRTAKKATAKRTKKTAVKKTRTRKATAKKTTVKKSGAKKKTARKTVAKKRTAKRR